MFNVTKHKLVPKHTLLSDIFNLIGIIPYDKSKYVHDKKKKIPGGRKDDYIAYSKIDAFLFLASLKTL